MCTCTTSSAPPSPGRRGERGRAAASDAFREQVEAELRRLQEDVLWTEKAHFATATSYARLHCGWASSLRSQRLSPPRPSSGEAAPPWRLGRGPGRSRLGRGGLPQAPRHRDVVLTTGRRLGSLRVKVRQTLNLDLHPSQPERPDVWRALAASLAEERRRPSTQTRQGPPPAPSELHGERSRRATSTMREPSRPVPCPAPWLRLWRTGRSRTPRSTPLQVL